MSFVSLSWLGWMAGTAAAHWAAPARARPWVVPAVTVAFLLWAAPMAALVMGLCVVGVARAPATSAGSAVAAGLLLVAFLGWRLAVQLPPGPLGEVVMPLGFAYTLIRCLHVLLERYKRTLPPHGAAELAQYLLFLPTLVVGPIHRLPAFLQDQRRLRWNAELASEGLERVVLGYARVVILGSFLLGEVGPRAVAAAGAVAGPLGAWAEIVRYALALYVQFAGYSDVAIGFALVLGYRVMENFDRPFLKTDLSAFWAAWHMSLTRFVRDDLFRLVVATTRRPAVAAVASMVVIGVWHELSVRYLLWGVWHGAGIAAWQVWRRRVTPGLPELPPALAPVATALSVLLTFHFVAVGFTLVRGDDAAEGQALLAALLGGGTP